MRLLLHSQPIYGRKLLRRILKAGEKLVRVGIYCLLMRMDKLLWNWGGSSGGGNDWANSAKGETISVVY